MRIETGQAEDHPTPLPLDASHSPGVASPTPREPEGTAQGGVYDATAARLAQLGAEETAWTGAMHAGMSADADRRGRYEQGINPLGATGHGDQLALPETNEHSKHQGGDDEGYRS
jgi:hypothetical protein